MSLSPTQSLLSDEKKEFQISVGRGMHFVDKISTRMRRVWTGLATRLGGRKSGLLKLQKDVRSCEYRDVQVMWEMLRRSELGIGESPKRCKKRPLKRCFESQWTRRSPLPRRGF